jgi:hypothetical protein
MHVKMEKMCALDKWGYDTVLFCLCAVPPSWVVEPADTSVERNKHIMLHCQAQGVPQPTVVWKKATGMGRVK